MKVHKVTLLVVDFDDIGPESVKDVIENEHYPNRCMTPRVMEIETKQVAWHDEHPLNYQSTQLAAFQRLFSPKES